MACNKTSLAQRTTQITQGHRKPFDINTNLKYHQHEFTGKKNVANLSSTQPLVNSRCDFDRLLDLY